LASGTSSAAPTDGRRADRNLREIVDGSALLESFGGPGAGAAVRACAGGCPGWVAWWQTTQFWAFGPGTHGGSDVRGWACLCFLQSFITGFFRLGSACVQTFANRRRNSGGLGLRPMRDRPASKLASLRASRGRPGRQVHGQLKEQIQRHAGNGLQWGPGRPAWGSCATAIPGAF